MLRVDTPDDLRDFDRQCTEGGTALGIGMLLGGFGALIALFVGGLLAMTPGYTTVVAVCALYVLLYLAGVGYFLVQSHRLAAWKFAPRIGARQIHAAPRQYAKVSPEAREQALALVKTMYALADTDVIGDTARARVVVRMQERVEALSALVDVEDKLRLAVAGQSVDDMDLAASAAWRQAMAEVEAKVRDNLGV